MRHTTRILRLQRGFTLIELLVVIIVIGILSAMSVVVVRTAMNSGKGATVKTQMQQLVIALDSYKAKVGEYPPDNFLDTEALRRHLKKRWPRARYDDIVSAFLTLVDGVVFLPEDDAQTTANKQQLRVQLDARSSYVSPLIIWLGGPVINGRSVGFCLSPTDPFSLDLNAQREEPFFKFPEKSITRLNDVWAFMPQEAPILYFRSEPKAKYFRGETDTSTISTAFTDFAEYTGIKYWPMDAELDGGAVVCGVWGNTAAEYGTVTPFISGFESNEPALPWFDAGPIWCDADSFQLIHPGMDKAFALPVGEDSLEEFRVNSPRLIGDLTPADEDTITSFSEGLTAGSEK